MSVACALDLDSSLDTVQPNAPGTQGYNRYAYVANNPATWTDPSGHAASDTACRTGVNSFVGAQLNKILGASVLGWLVAKHGCGVYTVVIGAGLLGAGGMAEDYFGKTPGVRAGEAIAGGLLVANALWVSLAIGGTSHMSTFSFTMILLAGVLLLLAAIVFSMLADLVESSQLASYGSLACKDWRDSPDRASTQSPIGRHPGGVWNVSRTVPETPSDKFERLRPATHLSQAD